MAHISDDLPRISVKALTEDQMAMLELLGVNRVRQTTPVTFYVTDDDPLAIDGKPHIAEHHCPLVTWRGRERIVMPDGALETLNRRAAND